ncbi:hypothetical protein BG004_003295 [Podila humilis]|nr:hypothetical protein BG004_003295 [Podila humilis]
MISKPSSAAAPPLLLVPSTSAFSTAPFFLPTPTLTGTSPINVQHHRRQEQQSTKASSYRSRRSPASRVARLSKNSIASRQRRSHNPLPTSSSSIFGKWDIHIRSEHRPKARGKSRAANGGGGGRGGISTAFETQQSGSIQSTQPAAQQLASQFSSTMHQDGGQSTTTSTTTTASIPTASNHKSGRRIPSSDNLASNATTAWTIGQQRAGSQINGVPPIDSTFVNHTGVSVTTEPAKLSQWMSPKSTGVEHVSLSPQLLSTYPRDNVPTVSASQANGHPHHSASPFSARSTFLRAIGKFRNKHQQKRSNATPAPNSGSSGNAPSTTASSFVLPPIRLENTESLDSDQISSAYTNRRSDVGTVSMVSFAGSSKTKDGVSVELQDIDMEDSQSHSQPQPPPATFTVLVAPSIVHIEQDRASTSSSLRTKFKNKVNSTLASIKSSSNPKDKSRSAQSSQQSSPTTIGSTYGSSQVSPTTIGTSTSQYDSSPSPTSSAPPKSTKLPKTFWTFPRSRPESGTASKQMPWGDTTRPSSYAGSSGAHTGHSEQHPSQDDSLMVSPELGPTDAPAILQSLGHDANDEQDIDSDDSIDIIMPGDYDDYTPFAELSLKKRKKMEAAAAAATTAAANKDQNQKKPHAVKRLLEKGKRKNQSNDSSSVSATFERTESLGPQAASHPYKRNSKKRPKDQDSIEQKQGQEPNKMVKGNSEEPSEWRRALMRSLHLGRSNQTRQKSKEETDQSSLAQIQESGEQGLEHANATNDGTIVRLRRSESIQSTRSRTLATSTHAALLATTIPVSRGPGLRRETLEMAMRRRRRSSAARSNLYVGDVPPMSGSARSSIYGDANITHTFTSFTLELADMHARDVVNNSATPGLFNFKQRPPRQSISVAAQPGHQVDTDQEFRGFDSDGDALSGYTGDADISMEEVFVRPRTPSVAGMKPLDARDKGKARDSGVGITSSSNANGRRKLSIIDGESDTVPELPTLTIRTRDLNRSGSGAGRNSGTYARSQHMAENSSDSPRSPPRRSSGQAASPTLHRKPSRNLVSAYSSGVSPAVSSPVNGASPSSSPSKGTATPNLSMEEIVSWKPRNIMPSTAPRPPVPSVDTSKPALTTRGSGLSSSTTLIPSSRTPYSAGAPAFTVHSPGIQATLRNTGEAASPLQLATATAAATAAARHQRQPSLQHVQSQHQQQASNDTLLPNHLKNFSTASTLSASSGYSAQTLTSHSGLSTVSQPVEFDPNQKFPTTPVDLKTMDFESLLQVAEQEQRKGWDELSLQKKSQAATAFSNGNINNNGGFNSGRTVPRLSATPHSLNNNNNNINNNNNNINNNSSSKNAHPLGLHVVKNKSGGGGLSSTQAKSAPNLDALGGRQQNQSSVPNHSTHSSPGGGGSSKGSGIHQLYTNSNNNRVPKSATTTSHLHPAVGHHGGRVANSSNAAVAFDLGPEGPNSSGGRPSQQTRSKRVMKKKMSVIKLSGAVQGGRDHDGVIRVSVSSNGDPNQWRS